MTETTDKATFARQCAEAGQRTIDLLFSYPRPVAICVLPGILAAVMGAMELPRDVVVAMLDSALDDIRNGTS